MTIRLLLSLVVVAAAAIAHSRTALAVDEYFVTNSNSNAVTVYARKASGNAAIVVSRA